MSFLYKTLNCTWWWGSGPGALENVGYLLIVIMVIPDNVPSMDQIELFNHLLHLKKFNCVETND